MTYTVYRIHVYSWNHVTEICQFFIKQQQDVCGWQTAYVSLWPKPLQKEEQTATKDGLKAPQISATLSRHSFSSCL